MARRLLHRHRAQHAAQTCSPACAATEHACCAPALQEALREQDDALDQFVVDTHLLPRTLNGIPEDLPAPVDTQELWGDDAPTGQRTLQRLDSLDVLQQQYAHTAKRAGGGTGRADDAGNMGGFRQLGQVPPGAANSRAAGRYASSAGGGHAAGAGLHHMQAAPAAEGRRTRPNLVISTKKPPGSPVILRGDHLPSPTRSSSKPGGNKKAGRPRGQHVHAAGHH